LFGSGAVPQHAYRPSAGVLTGRTQTRTITRMTTRTATQARAELYRLLDEVAETHVPITITARRHNGVLVAEEDWRAIQETLYLLAIPGMRESIRKGLRTPIGKTSEKPGW
jgi:antitoxin YefM